MVRESRFLQGNRNKHDNIRICAIDIKSLRAWNVVTELKRVDSVVCYWFHCLSCYWSLQDHSRSL